MKNNKRFYKPFLYVMLLIFFAGCTTTDGNNARKNFSRDNSFVKGNYEPSIQNSLDKALESYNTAWELWESNDVEGAFASLDQAYTFVLEVDESKNPDLIQQKDDLRLLISKRILEIYSSQHNSVKGSYKEIPIVVNDAVKREIKRFQGVERKFFLQSYARSGEYRPMILAKLKAAGLPEDLFWLPLIESGFKVKAYSHAKALGLWQFIPSTGYKFGMKRDHWMDERMDPEKSTAAAIAYMIELHNMFGDWMTVLAAYNSGEGRVMRLIRSQKVKYLDDFWDLQHRLPMETSRYVPRFMATLAIIKEPQKYGFELNELNSPIEFETVTVNKSMHLKSIAKKTGYNLKVLEKLNAELRLQATPPKEYALKVPKGMKEILMVKVSEIPEWKAPEREFVYHRVRRGETLSHLAKKYRTSVSSIMRFNRIRSSKRIYIGQKIKIPTRYASSKPSFKPVNGKGIRYMVKNGDTLWALSRKYGISTKKIKVHNRLKGNMLHKGQVLVIPKG